jgi:hypothetical protein
MTDDVLMDKIKKILPVYTNEKTFYKSMFPLLIKMEQFSALFLHPQKLTHIKPHKKENSNF